MLGDFYWICGVDRIGLTLTSPRYTDPGFDKTAKDWVAKITSYVKNRNEERTGQKLCTPANFCIGPDYESVEEVYGENLPRLKTVKAKYDPDQVWRRGWVIEPDSP